MKIDLREVQLSKSRPTVLEAVKSLAASMDEIGLLNPIIVKRATVFDGTLMIEGYKVIAGNHRVCAARELGWAWIPAFVHDGDELQAELAEIDENLLRAELSPAQRAAAVARRKEIWEVMHPTELSPESGINSRRPGRPAEFATDTAKATGENPKRTREHLARAEALGSDLHAVVGTSLDKGVELDALKELSPEERRELIERAKAGEQVSARFPVERDAGLPGRLVAMVAADFARMLGKLTPEDVAQAMASQPVNPDLRPYVEAFYNAYRARKQAA
ncbi:ParB N-terminal domain-containing protein [Pseudoxanthomonas beigongshangi]